MRARHAGRCLASLLSVCALGVVQAADQEAGAQGPDAAQVPLTAPEAARPANPQPATAPVRKTAAPSPEAFAAAAAARARPRVLRETSTALVVSHDGWAIVPAPAVRDCASIDAIVGGRARSVVPAADAPSRELALVRIEGGEGRPFRFLSPRRESLPKDRALTLLGHDAGASLSAHPRVSVAFSSTDDRDDLKNRDVPWITVAPGTRLAHAAVLDDHGHLVGVMQQRKGEKPGQLIGRVWRAEAVRGLLKFHGVDWPSVSSKGTGLAVAQVLRDTLSATMQVACYREP
jgi:hypothetical protein